MRPKELYSNVDALTGSIPELTIHAVLAMTRRDWAVRVLDAWAVATQRPIPMIQPDRRLGTWSCFASVADERVEFTKNSPDAARHAAALAVFPTLDRNAPNWPGECP